MELIQQIITRLQQVAPLHDLVLGVRVFGVMGVK
jgi:hypothetical protein